MNTTKKTLIGLSAILISGCTFTSSADVDVEEPTQGNPSGIQLEGGAELDVGETEPQAQ